jgi:hypothetical protein
MVRRELGVAHFALDRSPTTASRIAAHIVIFIILPIIFTVLHWIDAWLGRHFLPEMSDEHGSGVQGLLAFFV